MQAIREIMEAKTSSLTINIPDRFINHQLEVIILPIHSHKKAGPSESFFAKFAKNPIKVKKIKHFSRDELYD